MTLQTLEQILKAETPDVYELSAPNAKPRFVCWFRLGNIQIPGDDSIQMELPRVQIDIVTQSTTDDLDSRIKAALCFNHIPYRETAVRFDMDYQKFVTSLVVVVV